MKEGPDITRIAALIGDPTRATMLSALLGGTALTASELAREAGVTAQTASSHLSKLEAGGLVEPRKQGRHRYYSLGGDEVLQLLENLTGLAAKAGHLRTRPGPRDPALRHARVCYDHLAGELAVGLFESLEAQGFILAKGPEVSLTSEGGAFFSGLGIDTGALDKGRRPLCRACLDWSQRRSHLAGSLGAALLQRIYAEGWAKREADSRTVTFSAAGERALAAAFGLSAAG